MIETHEDALAWYESRPRIVTKDFIDAIPWKEIVAHPLDPAFVPVLLYMRDIETATTMYRDELLMTPTGKNRAVREFMDRWAEEEPLHGELLNRFLEEAGYPSEDRWFDKIRERLPRGYRAAVVRQAAVAHAFGRRFSAVHMTFGAIQELSTLTGYQRLWGAAKHPVLEQLLRGIVREESTHYFFYWSVARIELLRSGIMQGVTREIVKRFWRPVGEGTKRPDETDYVIRTLFSGEGVQAFDRQVTARVSDLPGMAGLDIMTRRIASAVNAQAGGSLAPAARG